LLKFIYSILNDIFHPIETPFKSFFQKMNVLSPLIFIFFSLDFCATGVRHMPEVYMIRFFRKNLKIGDTHGKKDDCV